MLRHNNVQNYQNELPGRAFPNFFFPECASHPRCSGVLAGFTSRNDDYPMEKKKNITLSYMGESLIADVAVYPIISVNSPTMSQIIAGV